jgi:hypothetical protein
VERVEGLTPMPEWIAAYEEINQFERTLADDGTVFIKFWLHISREEQLRRFLDLSTQPETAWQVAAEDWEHHRKYDEYLAAVRDMLASTHTPYAPWTVVPSTDRDYRLYTVFRTIIARLEAALDLPLTDWEEPDLVKRESKKAEKKAEKKAAKQTEKKADQKEDKRDNAKAEKKAKKAAKKANKQATDHERDDGVGAVDKPAKPKKAKKLEAAADELPTLRADEDEAPTPPAAAPVKRPRRAPKVAAPVEAAASAAPDDDEAA